MTSNVETAVQVNVHLPRFSAYYSLYSRELQSGVRHVYMMTWIQGTEVADPPVTTFTLFLNRISIKNMSVASPDIPICILGGGRYLQKEVPTDLE
mgnify:CR=1 FL=1